MSSVTLQELKSIRSAPYLGDSWLLFCVMVLLAFGLVMMTSASIEIASNTYGDGFFFLKRQLRFIVIGLLGAAIVLMMPLNFWREWGILLLVAAIALLTLVLIPGVGREVNGSMRWLNLGFMTIQASEPAKLFIVIFLAGFLCKYQSLVMNTWTGFLAPLLITLVPVVLLLMEPDFGAVVVLMLAVFGMMFMSGVKLHQFLVLIALGVGGGLAVIFSAEYRVARVQTFLTALSDPFHESVVFGSGYQLAQALIAFGRGEWFGVGLGNSIQKLYFLPEAHTDFVLAIIAEELGLFMVLMLLGLFFLFCWRIILIARRNELNGDRFSACVGYGIAFLFIGQILINVGVNIGLLPTKGLTLPFISAGGSSLIMCIIMVAILLKIDINDYQRNRLPFRVAGRAGT